MQVRRSHSGKIQSCVPLTLNDALPYIHPYYCRAPWLPGSTRILLNRFIHYVCHLPSVQIRVSNVLCHLFFNLDWALKVQFNGIVGVVLVSALQICTFDHLTLALPSNSNGAATNMKNNSRYDLDRFLISAFCRNIFHYVTGQICKYAFAF